MPNPIPNLLDQAHQAVARVIRPGDFAVDCTVGNGHDTIHLARCVGPTGRVLGLDIDARALEIARNALEAEELSGRVRLVQGSHADLRTHVVTTGANCRPRVVMFNLGYRPRGDHELRTLPETTVEALRQSYQSLDPPALLSIVAYRGHPGGELEYRAVLDWASRLDADYEGPRSLRPRVLESRFLHDDHVTGSLFLIGLAALSSPAKFQ